MLSLTAHCCLDLRHQLRYENEYFARAVVFIATVEARSADQSLRVGYRTLLTSKSQYQSVYEVTLT